MKIIGLVLALMLLCGVAQAQCVAEIKDVKQDEVRGSIIVETQYTLNGEVVQLGRTRYLETSGTNQEIIDKAKEDISIHCENLIRRIETNRTFLQVERLKIQKALTQPIIDDIKSKLVGVKDTKTQVIDEYKGKDVKVTYDSKNTVSITAVTP